MNRSRIQPAGAPWATFVAVALCSFSLLSGCSRGQELPVTEGEPAANPVAAAAITPWTGDYRPFVIASVNRLERGPLGNPNRLLADGTLNYAHEVAEMAALQGMAFDWTGDRTHLTIERDDLADLREIWRTQTANGTKPFAGDGDFFLGFPLVLAFRHLQINGGLPADPAFAADFEAMARGICHPAERGTINPAASRAVGVELALQVFPDLDADGTRAAYVDQVCNDLTGAGDTIENATNYNSIYLSAMIELLRLRGREADWRSAPLRAMLARYAAQIPPSGLPPAYGDDGSGQAESSISIWPAIFEYAATTYQDPSYRELARRIFNAQRDQAMHPVRGTQSLFWLALGQSWTTSSMTPEPGPNFSPNVPRAQILARKGTAGPVPDKALLTGDGAYALLELATVGHHAHREQAGALLQYEHNGTVFLHGLGYHNRLPEQADEVLLAPESAGFPLRTHIVNPGAWQEAVLPTEGMTPDPGHPDQPYARTLRDLTLRIQHDSPVAKSIWIEDMYLSGPEGTRRVMDFSDGQVGFHRASLERDANGVSAVCLTTAPGLSFFPALPKLPIDFDCNQYPLFRFMWKPETGIVTPGDNRLLMVRTGGAEYDLNVGLAPFCPVLQDAHLSANAGDQAGATAHFDDIYELGSHWQRSARLGAAGVLVVSDHIQGAPTMTDDFAGPLWHLVIDQAPDSGSTPDFDWFDAGGFDASGQRLLIAFPHDPAQTTGVSQPAKPFWDKVNPFTVWARRSLSPGVDDDFLSVMVPHPASQSGADLAATLSLQGNVLTVALGGKPVQVNLGE